MLVECPRCHFKQPQDQYCASCGVDMLAYKPKEEPILKKILKSGLFQFMMVVFLGIAVTYFVIRSDRPQQWIQKINRFTSISHNPKAKTEAGIAEDLQEFEAPPASANTWAARAAVVSSSSEASATTSTTSAASTASASVIPSTVSSVTASAVTKSASTTIRMLEVDNEFINTMLQRAHTANVVLQDNEVKIFIMPSNVALTSARTLYSTNVQVVNGEAAQATYGNATRGLSLTVALTNHTDTATTFRLNINKVHPNDSFEIPADFTLRSGEKLVIAGNALLSYFEYEADLANTAPFQIFRSADYRNQKTTFAIEIELQ